MLDLQIRLQEADRRIAEWRTLIATQKGRIAELQKAGHSATGSIIFLRELEGSLSSMRSDRDAIARRIERKRKMVRVVASPLPAHESSNRDCTSAQDERDRVRKLVATANPC